MNQQIKTKEQYEWFAYQMARLSDLIASEVGVEPEFIAEIVQRFIDEVEQHPVDIIATTKMMKVMEKLENFNM